MDRKYTDAEKAEYWKQKALAKNKGYGSEKYQKKYQKPKKAKGEKSSGKSSGPFKGAGEFVGGLGASALFPEGGPLSTAVGSFLGGKIGHLVDKIVGFGDYQIKSNSIMRGGMTAPQIMNSVEAGGVVVRFREYVQDILATTVFTAQSFPLNPGQRKSFPWLSQFAKNFDQYRWRGIIWEFGSTSSDAVLSSATSSALGTVSMATDYDVLDATYSSKREMLNTMFANSSKPSNSFIHPIECKRAQTPMAVQYVRTGEYPEGGDPRFYDLGNTVIATEGMQAATGAVGELWVTYEVEFFKQQVGDSGLSDHWLLTTCGTTTNLGSIAPTLASGSSLGGTVESGNLYRFPSYVTNGKFLFTFNVFGVAAVIGQIALTIANGALFDAWSPAGTNFLQTPGTGTNTTGVQCQFVVNVTGADCTVTFGSFALPALANVGDLWIVEIDPDSAAVA